VIGFAMMGGVDVKRKPAQEPGKRQPGRLAEGEHAHLNTPPATAGFSPVLHRPTRVVLNVVDRDGSPDVNMA